MSAKFCGINFTFRHCSLRKNYFATDQVSQIQAIVRFSGIDTFLKQWFERFQWISQNMWGIFLLKVRNFGFWHIPRIYSVF